MSFNTSYTSKPVTTTASSSVSTSSTTTSSTTETAPVHGTSSSDLIHPSNLVVNPTPAQTVLPTDVNTARDSKTSYTSSTSLHPVERSSVVPGEEARVEQMTAQVEVPVEKYVTTHHERHTVPVMKERAVVEREPIVDEVRGMPIGEERREIPLTEERAYGQKVADAEQVKLGLGMEAVMEREKLEQREGYAAEPKMVPVDTNPPGVPVKTTTTL